MMMEVVKHTCMRRNIFFNSFPGKVQLWEYWYEFLELKAEPVHTVLIINVTKVANVFLVCCTKLYTWELYMITSRCLSSFLSPFLCRLRSIAVHRDHFVWRLSVRVCMCLCVCLCGSHTFLVVTHSYVSQATHAFLGMLPLCLYCLRLDHFVWVFVW